jgi:hypothetical protein
MSLEDQSFLDLDLTDEQIDQVIDPFADKPRPKLLKAKVSKASNMLLTQDVVRLGKGFTVAQAERFV